MMTATAVENAAGDSGSPRSLPAVAGGTKSKIRRGGRHRDSPSWEEGKCGPRKRRSGRAQVGMRGLAGMRKRTGL